MKPNTQEHYLDVTPIILRSSMVEQAAVNRKAVGSSPTEGARSCSSPAEHLFEAQGAVGAAPTETTSGE